MNEGGLNIFFYKGFGSHASIFSWINKYLKVDCVSYLAFFSVLGILTAVACPSLWFDLHLCPHYDHRCQASFSVFLQVSSLSSLGENFYF